MNESVDDRTRRTRNALAMALIKLTAKKSVDEITVGELVNSAGVGRSTFYLHYSNMGDFLANSFANMLVGMARRSAMSTAALNSILPSKHIFEHIYAARAHASSMQHSKQRPRMLAAGEARLRTLVEENLRQYSPQLRDNQIRPLSIFVVGGFMGLLKTWMESGCREPPILMQTQFEQMCSNVLKH